jgi:hypothetical protein
MVKSLSKRKFPTEIPEYFQHLKKDSLLCSKDLVIVFGYSSAETLHNSVRDGVFPKPDRVKNISRAKNKYFWHVKTICEYILKHSSLG